MAITKNSHWSECGVTQDLEGDEKRAWERLNGEPVWIYEQWHKPNGNIGLRRRQFAKYDSYEYQHTLEDGTQIWTPIQNYSE